MELESLNMYRHYDGKISGHIAFRGDAGKVEIVLQEDQMKKILAVCASRLIEQAQEAANNLTSAVIEAAESPQLEQKD